MLIIVSVARLLLPLLPTLSQTSRFIGCGNSETAFRRLRGIIEALRKDCKDSVATAQLRRVDV